MRYVRRLDFLDHERFCLPIIQQTMPEEVYMEAVTTLLNPDYVHIRKLWGMFENDALISFTGYIVENDIGWVSWTATDPTYQGQGCCTKLFREWVFPSMGKEKVYRLDVETYEHNMFYNAINFYWKLGFRLYRIVPNYLSDGSSKLFLLRE